MRKVSEGDEEGDDVMEDEGEISGGGEERLGGWVLGERAECREGGRVE